MVRKLKQRWKIKSNLQLFAILIVFSVSGSITLVLKTIIFNWINYSPEWPLFIKFISYLLTIVPVYQLTLLATGTLFGQFNFFWNFEKKTMRRLGIRLGNMKRP